MAAEDAGSIFAEVRIRLDKLQGDIAQTTARVDGLERDVTASTTSMEKKAKGNFTAMSVAAVAASTVIVASFRSLITSTASYGQALSDVQAATRGTAEDLAKLEQAASSAGDELATSTTDALGAVEALAKAGVSTADIMGGALPGALTLAAAGSMEVADAAEIAAATMTQFGLSGGDVVHIADLLAAGAGKAQGEVSDLSQALKQAGLVASQTGLSVDDTVGSLAAFASAGLLGSDAGTSFRTMLLRLTPQSKEAADEMERLGLNAFDAKGEFIGITAFAGQLQAQLKNLTTEQRNSALATIFGSDSIRAANVLYTQGAEGVAEWIDKVNDQGFAADTARIKLDNLNGDLKKFSAATNDASAKVGNSLTPAFRVLTQIGTAFFEFISKIPEPIQALIGTIGVLGGGLLAFAAAGPPVIATIAAIGTTAAAALGPIGLITSAIAILGATAAATIVAMDQQAIKEGMEAFGDIGREAGLSGKDLEDFARNTRRAEAAIAGLSATQVKMFKASNFKRLAEDIGITEDQLAQVFETSNKIPTALKNIAEAFADPARKSKEFADFQSARAAEIVERYGNVEAMAGKLGSTVKTVSDAIAFQNYLEKAGLITAEESLKAKIELRNAEIEKIIEAGEKIGFLTKAEQERIRQLKAFNDDNQATLDSLSDTSDEAWATQTALMEEFYARDAEALAQKEKDEADAWATQTSLMQEFYDRDEAERKKQEEDTLKLTNNILDAFSGLASALGDIFASIYQRQVDEATLAYEKERELIENNGLTKKQVLEQNLVDAQTTGDAQAIADAKRALDLYNLEADFTRKKAQLEYEAAMTQWRMQLAISAATAAQAILGAVAAPPYFPANAASVALAAGIGALQVGAVAASMPQPPQFATGGLVLPSGQGGRQVTVADQGGGELMFGTGTLGQPLMEGFMDGVADRVFSRLANTGKPVNLVVDGKSLTQIVVKYIDGGDVPMKSLKR